MEDWDDYRYFLAVKRTGSFSAAARFLKVSQPTVARHISVLEHRLDVRLFDQVTNGTMLTPAGAALTGKIEEMERLAESLKFEDLPLESKHTGTITVTATQTFASHWLAAKIDAFSHLFPDISVRCIASDAVLNIEDREVDIAFRLGRPKNSSVIGSRIAHIETGIYSSTTYAQRFGIPEKLDDLKNHKIVGTGDPIAKFPQIQELENLANQIPATASTNCSHTYISLALAGQGLICVPSFTVSNNPHFQRVLANDFAPTLELWLLFNPNVSQSARVRVFLDFIKQEIKFSDIGWQDNRALPLQDASQFVATNSVG